MVPREPCTKSDEQDPKKPGVIDHGKAAGVAARKSIRRDKVPGRDSKPLKCEPDHAALPPSSFTTPSMSVRSAIPSDPVAEGVMEPVFARIGLPSLLGIRPLDRHCSCGAAYIGLNLVYRRGMR